jgi:hypothetical protein
MEREGLGEVRQDKRAQLEAAKYADVAAATVRGYRRLGAVEPDEGTHVVGIAGLQHIPDFLTTFPSLSLRCGGYGDGRLGLCLRISAVTHRFTTRILTLRVES